MFISKSLAIQSFEVFGEDEIVVRTYAIEVTFGSITTHSSIVIGRYMLVVAVTNGFTRRIPSPGW